MKYSAMDRAVRSDTLVFDGDFKGKLELDAKLISIKTVNLCTSTFFHVIKQQQFLLQAPMAI